jgi:membrane-bound serine protease (ClpP class)
VPVLVWIGPSGARAGSAGVFVTLASHVAGMAPATNIGAAHPVIGPEGKDPEESGGKEMARKIENDTAAFSESLARQRGRNVEWAGKAVRESESIPADRAVEMNVVEMIAATPEAFLENVDGREVQLPGGPMILRTSGATLAPLEPSLGQRVAHSLANPGLAYVLFLVGGLGVAIELSHPGGIVPGLVGVVCIILALMAFAALPLQLGAVALLVIGLALLVTEIFVGHGVFAVAGVVLLGLGGALLVDRVDPAWFVDRSFAVPLRLIVPMVLAIGGAAGFIAYKASQTRALPQRAGDAGLVGESGKALTEVTADGGEIFVHGERWRAVASRSIAPGAPVVVRIVDGLTLHVEEI